MQLEESNVKLRIGFITNSSSTNFLIISSEDINSDFLFNKLGFVEGGKLEQQGRAMCDEIINGSYHGPRGAYQSEPTYEKIKEIFGEKAAEKFRMTKDAHVLWGETNSDDTPFTQFFTMDSFEIEDKNFYVNGRACMW